jgi:hypothetical protein
MQRRPVIYNKTMTLADTEYSQELPAWVKSFSIHCRGSYDIKFSYETGKVALGTSPYLTIPADTEGVEENLLGGGDVPMTIYFACSQAGQIAEITAWS